MLNAIILKQHPSSASHHQKQQRHHRHQQSEKYVVHSEPKPYRFIHNSRLGHHIITWQGQAQIVWHWSAIQHRAKKTKNPVGIEWKTPFQVACQLERIVARMELDVVISYGQQFVSTSKGKVGGGDDDDDKGAETHANSSQMQPASSKLSKVNPDATSIPLVESFFFRCIWTMLSFFESTRNQLEHCPCFEWGVLFSTIFCISGLTKAVGFKCAGTNRRWFFLSSLKRVRFDMFAHNRLRAIGEKCSMFFLGFKRTGLPKSTRIGSTQRCWNGKPTGFQLSSEITTLHSNFPFTVTFLWLTHLFAFLQARQLSVFLCCFHCNFYTAHNHPGWRRMRRGNPCATTDSAPVTVALFNGRNRTPIIAYGSLACTGNRFIRFIDLILLANIFGSGLCFDDPELMQYRAKPGPN